MIGVFTSPYVVPKAPRFLGTTRISRPSPADLRHRTVVSMSSCGGGHSSYWSSIEADVEAHLRRAIEVKHPISVYEPLFHFAVATPPPRSLANLAPALCVAAYDIVGGESRDESTAVAAALRLLYTVSCTHDPFLKLGGSKSMARDPYGSNIRLLIGDGMVPFAMEMLTRAHDPERDNSGRIYRVMIEATRAIGSQGVVEGQYREVLRRKSSDGGGLEESKHVEETLGMSEMMEGRIYACSAACGAILGGGSEGEVDKLRSYGLNVGKIIGLLNRGNKCGENNGEIMEKVEEMKGLAIKELRCFRGEKIEAMCSLIDDCLGFNLVYDKIA